LLQVIAQSCAAGSLKAGEESQVFHRTIRVSLAAALLAWVAGFTSMAYGQSAPPIPTNEQLSTLLAPIALYPDTLLAQICTAAGDPQQVLDVNNWVKQNSGLTGSAINDAAQQAGFDPAFVALVTFPSVLDQMAQRIDDYAAIGAAFKADQTSVTSAIQTLRQQAYASGALDSNEYQKVSVEQQNGTTVVIVQPTNPQVVYVPQYEPAQVYSSGPSTNDVLAASLVSFSVGIAVGAIISNNQPWGWSSWGWGWGGGGVYYRGSPWGWHYGYHSPYPPYRPRPPYYGRPIYPRPPPNWNNRPGYRPPPPGYRPPGPNRPPGYRPPPGGGGRPPGGGGNGRPPGSGGNPGNGGGNGRPPGSGGNPGNGGGNGRPPGGGGNPPGNGGGNGRPPGSGGPNSGRPTTRPAPNPYAGFQPGGNGRPSTRPAPTPQTTGARPGGFTGNSAGGGSERAASNRGRTSAGGGGNRSGGHRR
jgi:Protein of unknown function (DUF3300)